MYVYKATRATTPLIKERTTPVFIHRAYNIITLIPVAFFLPFGLMVSYFMLCIIIIYWYLYIVLSLPLRELYINILLHINYKSV